MKPTELLITTNWFEDESATTQNERGGSATSSRRSAATTLPLAAEVLRDQLTSFLTNLSPVIAEAAEAGNCGEYEIDEVTVSAEISTLGKVSILGTVGMDVGGKGGISFKFKRVKS